VIEVIQGLNDKKWFNQSVRVNMTRAAIVNNIACLGLALLNRALSGSVKETAIIMGRAFVNILIDDGLILPDGVKESWERSFDMVIKSKHVSQFPDLIDEKGRSWK